MENRETSRAARRAAPSAHTQVPEAAGRLHNDLAATATRARGRARGALLLQREHAFVDFARNAVPPCAVVTRDPRERGRRFGRFECLCLQLARLRAVSTKMHHSSAGCVCGVPRLRQESRSRCRLPLHPAHKMTPSSRAARARAASSSARRGGCLPASAGSFVGLFVCFVFWRGLNCASVITSARARRLPRALVRISNPATQTARSTDTQHTQHTRIKRTQTNKPC